MLQNSNSKSNSANATESVDPYFNHRLILVYNSHLKNERRIGRAFIMKVSVVIPAYNEEDFIENCVKSILQQDDLPDEIIVVDNNSSDNTPFLAQKNGVKVAKEKKQGLTYARNKGFDIAKYEIIARCDADVIVPSNWIKRIKYNFENKKIDALSGPVTFYDLAVKSTIPVRAYSKSLKLLLKGDRVLIGPNMAITKSMWERVKDSVNSDDSRVLEDVDLSINIVRAKGKIEYDPQLIVKTSARRIRKKPLSFFVEYPIRLVKTFWVNH